MKHLLRVKLLRDSSVLADQSISQPSEHFFSLIQHLLIGDLVSGVLFLELRVLIILTGVLVQNHDVLNWLVPGLAYFLDHPVVFSVGVADRVVVLGVVGLGLGEFPRLWRVRVRGWVLGGYGLRHLLLDWTFRLLKGLLDGF